MQKVGAAARFVAAAAGVSSTQGAGREMLTDRRGGGRIHGEGADTPGGGQGMEDVFTGKGRGGRKFLSSVGQRIEQRDVRVRACGQSSASVATCDASLSADRCLATAPAAASSSEQVRKTCSL